MAFLWKIVAMFVIINIEANFLINFNKEGRGVMPKFSIIVPVYNEESSLEKCIDSILNQTYDDYEIIIVNDGSTDNSRKIIQRYCQEHQENVKYIYQKRMGFDVARYKGVVKAKGEYVLFVNTNNYVENNLLKTLDKKLRDFPDIVRFQMKKIDKNKICVYRELPFESVRGENAFNKIIKYCCIHDINLYLYKKEFLMSYYKNLYKYIEPLYFVPFLLLQAKKVKSIGYVGCVVQNAQICVTAPEDDLKRYVEFEKHISKVNSSNLDIFRTYVANVLIKKAQGLKKKQYKSYRLLLENNKIFEYAGIKGYKKWVLYNFPKIYYKILEK